MTSVICDTTYSIDYYNSGTKASLCCTQAWVKCVCLILSGESWTFLWFLWLVHNVLLQRDRERERLFYILSMRPVEGMSAFRAPLQNPKVLLACLDLQGSLNISWITLWTLLITHYPLHVSVTQKNQQILTEHKFAWTYSRCAGS